MKMLRMLIKIPLTPAFLMVMLGMFVVVFVITFVVWLLRADGPGDVSLLDEFITDAKSGWQSWFSYK